MSPASSLPGDVHVEADAQACAQAISRWILHRARVAIAERDAFHVAFSGGSTPRLMFEALRGAPLRDETDWARWHVWFVDERAVSPDDARSNFHLARTLLDAVPIPTAQVHRMEGERTDLDGAAADYAHALETSLPHAPDGAPRLDVIHLGLGENGHTASLFPGDPSLGVADRWTVHSRADYEPFDRITLTFPVLNAGGAVAFAVAGSGKAEAFGGVLDGTAPSARVRPVDGDLHWFLDDAAAGSVP